MRWLRATLAALAVGALVVGCGSTVGGTAGGNGRVSGRLTDAAGGTVRIEGTNLRAPVGADGSFTLPNVPPGEYTLAVTAPGNQGGAVLVRVLDGEDTEVTEVELVEVGQIAGLVTNAANGQPIAGARITARLTPLMWAYGDATLPGVVDGVESVNGAASRAVGDDEDADRPPPRTAVTDANGSYVLTGALIGPYSIEVAADGFEAAEIGTWVGPGGTAPADAQLVPVDPDNATLEGTVTGTSDGITGPLSSVRVDIWPVSAGDFPVPMADGTVSGRPSTGDPNNIDPWMVPPFWQGKCTTTDAQGHYSIANITPGTYTVMFWRFGYTGVQQTVTFTEREQKVIDTAMVSNLVHISGTVSGRQGDGSVVPLAGAWVNAYGNVYMPPEVLEGRPSPGRRVRCASLDECQPPAGVAITDENGRYSLDVEGGRVTVSAFADGYEWTSVEVDVSSGAQDGVDIVLEPYVEPEPGEPGTGGGDDSGNGGGFGTGGGHTPAGGAD